MSSTFMKGVPHLWKISLAPLQCLWNLKELNDGLLGNSLYGYKDV